MKLKFLLFSFSLFTIGAAREVKAQYCTPNYLFGCILGSGDQIESFNAPGANSTLINDLATGCSTGSWKVDTGTSVSYNSGATYNHTVTSGTTSDNVQVFIDFNNDMTFGSGESVGGANGSTTSTTIAYSISIPSGATPGPHRMRIVLTGDGMYPNILACPTPNYGAGEVHDYTAVILSGCDTPSGLAASAITFDGATFNWMAVTGATGYQYALNTSPTPPGAGTGTTLTSYTASGLMSNTVYYFHVRTACGNSFSAWTTIMITTSACTVPTGVTQSAVTATTATISWTAVPGAQGYQYAVNTSMTPPTTGTYTTATSVPVTGLTANTTYHTWVRTVCGQADTSAWNPMHMWTTAYPASVSGVNGSNLSLDVYPNPVKNVVTIASSGTQSAKATVHLTDVTGKLMNSYTFTGKELTIDMSGLSSGVYFLRYSDSEHRQTIKINKE
jgi:hypothetical protein